MRIKFKRIKCSICKQPLTCHIKNGKYLCAACYTKANQVQSASA